MADFKQLKPELLAPAGNLEKLKFAVHYGADAVYIGGQKYGLRSNADNFTFDEMADGVRFAKSYGAKVFVATNIYAHQEDISGLPAYLAQLQEIGIYAIIAADPIIMMTARQAAPKLEVHLSTQQSTMNWQAVQFWKELGIERVVLAREVSMEQIIEIKRHVDIEIEAFIHGAMCSSYSGRCVMSNHFTDRDSNRGGCSQSCRWKYDLYHKTQSQYQLVAEEIEFDESQRDAFSMGAKDLSMLEHVPALIESGIDSFKIEGRMRSIHYVATVVHAYRQAIDAYFQDPVQYKLQTNWLEDLWKAANRPLNTGFYFDEPDEQDHIYEAEDKPAEYDFAGLVLDYDPVTSIATIEQRNHFKIGQEIEFLRSRAEPFKQVIEAIWDNTGSPLDVVRHPLQIVKFRTAHPVAKWDMMRKKSKSVTLLRV
jgi:putative protease